MALSDPTPERLKEDQLSSLGLLDEEHMTMFRNALERVLLNEVSESTYAEILDGLPTLNSWNEFHYWVTGLNPVVELEHKELCDGSRERAKKLRAEFDIYTLRFPTQVCSSITFVSQREGSEGRGFCANLFSAIKQVPFPAREEKANDKSPVAPRLPGCASRNKGVYPGSHRITGKIMSQNRSSHLPT